MDQSAHNRDFWRELINPERGDRVFSLLDLIELKTFDLDLAAWLVAQVSRGTSYITGSGPGGIGKTTTMRSLLSFVPPNLRFALALPGQVASIGGAPHCAISNELSDHPPPTYLWGQDLRDFFALADQGHLLVGNMHADDIDEVREQIVEANAVPLSQFRAVGLFIFLCLEGGNPPGRRIKDTTTRRVINKIFYSDGATEHELIYTPAGGLMSNAPRDTEYEGRCRVFLEANLGASDRNLETLYQRFWA